MIYNCGGYICCGKRFTRAHMAPNAVVFCIDRADFDAAKAGFGGVIGAVALQTGSLIGSMVWIGIPMRIVT